MMTKLCPVDRRLNCEICNEKVATFGRSTILGTHRIEYFRCVSCGFLQTENPYWLDEAYSSPIASLDLGLLHRNQRFARIAFRVLKRVVKMEGKCIDYGGGYGVFVRMMRDLGIPFFHHDPIAKNLFAQSFTACVEDSFMIATAFEVLEHLTHPNEHFALLDRLAPHWLVSTELLPDEAPDLDDWWYYLQDTGQHISFYSRKSLDLIAFQYGRRVISIGTGLHFFTTSKLPASYIRWILRGRSSRLFDRFIKTKSLLQSDFNHVKELLLKNRIGA